MVSPESSPGDFGHGALWRHCRVGIYFFFSGGPEQTGGRTPDGTAVTAVHTVNYFWGRQLEEASIKIKSVIQWVLKPTYQL